MALGDDRTGLGSIYIADIQSCRVLTVRYLHM
jgi:hypothetical protein